MVICSVFLLRPAGRRLLCTLSSSQPKKDGQKQQRDTENPQPAAVVFGSGYILEHRTGIWAESFMLRAGKQTFIPRGHFPELYSHFDFYRRQILEIFIGADERSRFYNWFLFRTSSSVLIGSLLFKEHRRPAGLLVQWLIGMKLSVTCRWVMIWARLIHWNIEMSAGKSQQKKRHRVIHRHVTAAAEGNRERTASLLAAVI